MLTYVNSFLILEQAIAEARSIEEYNKLTLEMVQDRMGTKVEKREYGEIGSKRFDRELLLVRKYLCPMPKHLAALVEKERNHA